MIFLQIVKDQVPFLQCCMRTNAISTVFWGIGFCPDHFKDEVLSPLLRVIRCCSYSLAKHFVISLQNFEGLTAVSTGWVANVAFFKLWCSKCFFDSVVRSKVLLQYWGGTTVFQGLLTLWLIAELGKLYFVEEFMLFRFTVTSYIFDPL